MSRPFPSDGLLENRPLYKVLAEVSSQQLSGILTVSGESDTVDSISTKEPVFMLNHTTLDRIYNLVNCL